MESHAARTPWWHAYNTMQSPQQRLAKIHHALEKCFENEYLKRILNDLSGQDCPVAASLAVQHGGRAMLPAGRVLRRPG